MSEHFPPKDLCTQLRALTGGNRLLGYAAAETLTEAEAELERRQAKIMQLRTTLTGISTCSTCEACRGAALRALGVQCDHDPMSHGSTLECDSRGALICKHCDTFDRSHARAAQPLGEDRGA